MIYLFLADGFEEIEALTPADLLRRAGAAVKTVGVTGKTVSGSHGISVAADLSAEEALAELDGGAEIDMIILPGGMPGAKNLDESPLVDAFIKEAVAQNAYTAAICAAPFVLGRRGLLSGCRAVCYPGFESELKGALVENTGVVEDGKRITARAMGSAVEFALTLVRLMCGEDAARKVGEAIII